MNYFVTRDNQQYGPYTLAELQRYLAEGNILPTDLARSEGFDQWIPVQQIVGNIAVQQPPPPGPTNYGQVPVYGSASPAAQYAAAPSGPVPPGLHWAIVLLLYIVTCGIFGIVWIFVEAAFVQKLRTESKPLVFYGIGTLVLFVGGAMSSIDDLKLVGALLELGGAVLMVAGHFSIKNALEDYYNRVEPIGLQLSGVMVFFFNMFYFQYHFTKIRKWKLTGQGTWGSGGSGIPSFRDSQPQPGVVYTQSELDAMRNRPPQP